MKHHWLLLLLFSACLSNQGAAVNDAEYQRCESNNVEARIGATLNLISHVDPFDECYFVSTEKSTDNQCCYEGPSKKYCKLSKKYKHGNQTECLKEDEYSVKIESKRSQTCNLTIESFSEAASGGYKSYRGALKGDHEEIEECNVLVRAEAIGLDAAEASWLGIGLVVLLVLLVLCCCWCLKRALKRAVR